MLLRIEEKKSIVFQVADLKNEMHTHILGSDVGMNS